MYHKLIHTEVMVPLGSLCRVDNSEIFFGILDLDFFVGQNPKRDQIEK